MNKAFSIFISACVVILSAAMVVLPDSDFSEKENRKLASFPEFSVYEFIDGNYMRDIGTYLNDQFPLRDSFMGIKTAFEKNLLRKKEVNNIFICRDGYYIEKYSKAENTQFITEKINSFAEKVKSSNVDFMLVPTAFQIYGDKLPKNAAEKPNMQYDDMQTLFDGINGKNISKINPSTILEDNKNSQLFYKLDHHWTSHGAYLAYIEYCKTKGLTPQGEEEFDKLEVDDFYGTIYSKVNDYSIKEGDTITVYSKPDWNIDVTFDDKQSNSIYNFDYSNKKDKYSIFLDNLHPYISIVNNNSDSNKSLVVVKDSFANAFVPFLVDHYKTIYVFDTRYYRDSVADFVNDNKVTDVLLLFNMNSIDKESAINGLY